MCMCGGFKGSLWFIGGGGGKGRPVRQCLQHHLTNYVTKGIDKLSANDRRTFLPFFWLRGIQMISWWFQKATKRCERWGSRTKENKKQKVKVFDYGAIHKWRHAMLCAFLRTSKLVQSSDVIDVQRRTAASGWSESQTYKSKDKKQTDKRSARWQNETNMNWSK